MTDFLTDLAASRPTTPAVVDDRPGAAPVVLDFAGLDAEANRLGHLLVTLGAGPGVKVLWCGANSIPLVVATHAIRRVGAVGVPLNYRLTADEAAYVVDNSDAEIAWVDAPYAELFERIRPRCPRLREVLVFDSAAAGADPLRARLDPLPATPPPVPTPAGGSVEGAGGVMIYTSGTTGRPKGAVRPPGVNPAQLAGLVALIGYVPEDVYLTTGPLYHSGPGGFAGIAHVLGNTVVVQHHFDPEDWLRLVETYRVTTTFTAPTPIRMICGLPEEVKGRYDRSSMRRMIANAAPWTLALKQRYLADFPTDSLWEVYGSTELGVDTVLGPEDHLRKPGSCGRPAPGVEIKLFDANGAEVTEPYATGELYVRAAAVYSTYYKAEDKYEADSRGDFHTVGDIAYLDEEGYVYIADRKHDMIITGGMNVYPAEVEAALDACPDIDEVAVFGIPDEQWGETVHAVVVPARPGVVAADIEVFAREHLASYKVPRSVSFTEALPKTGSGKVLKRELKAEVAPPTGTSL